jgi:hypothetical protein
LKKAWTEYFVLLRRVVFAGLLVVAAAPHIRHPLDVVVTLVE